MDNCFLLLGTNMGDKFSNLSQVRLLILHQIGKIVQASSIYRTAAWGKTEQGDFFNQVIQIEMCLAPSRLLEKCLEIEKKMGRVRYEKWGERLIDIDILYYNDLVITEEHLKIPHLEIHNRRFTLMPLTEIAPDYIHPRLQQTNRELLQTCADPLQVDKTTPQIISSE